MDDIVENLKRGALILDSPSIDRSFELKDLESISLLKDIKIGERRPLNQSNQLQTRNVSSTFNAGSKAMELLDKLHE